MKNTCILVTVILVLCMSCIGQDSVEKRLIYNDLFKWTISIPEGFDTVSAARWSSLKKRGQDAVENTHGIKVEDETNQIFVFQHDNANYFEALYQSFDPAVDGDQTENFREASKMIFETFEAELGGAELDSAYSMSIISGLKFLTFTVRIIIAGKLELKWMMFSRLFGNVELTVNILTMDRQKEKELMDAWMQSKFGK